MKIEPAFSTAHKICELISVSKSFLRDRRDSGDWKEGIHWVYLNPENHKSGIRYNTDLCLHWLATRSCPQEHERAVRLYLNALNKGNAATPQ